MKPVQVVTQKELALALGLSRMGVSLALRGSPRVSPETRARVRAEAERRGYRPDPALGALSRYRHGRGVPHYRETLAFVTKWTEPEGWRRDYVHRFFAGASAGAERMGYRLEPFWLGRYRSQAKASAVLAARGIRGLLLAPLEQPGTLRLEWERFASVAVGPTLIEPAVDRVMHDYAGSAGIVVAALANRGYRRVALVLPSRVDRITEHRVANTFIAEAGRMPACREWTAWFPPDETERTFLRWVRMHRPDCVVSLGAGHLAWLRAGGWRVPAQIGVVSLHIKDDEENRSGIDYGAEEIGAAAAERLDTLLQRHATGLPARPVTVLIPGRWREGGTVRVGRGGRLNPSSGS